MDSTNKEEENKSPHWSFSDYPVLNPLQKGREEWFRADLDDLKPHKGVVVNASIEGLVLGTKKYNWVVIWPVEPEDLKHEHLQTYVAEHKDKTITTLRGEVFYTTKLAPLLFERSPVEVVYDDNPPKFALLLRRMPSEYPAPDPDKPIALVAVDSADAISKELADYTLENVVRVGPDQFQATVSKKLHE